MKQKLGTRNVAALLLIGFAGNIAWAVENQYYNVYLFNVLVPNTFYVSLMVAITAIVSTGTAILMGAWSDIKGKRRSFIIISFICWAFTTAAFPLSSRVDADWLKITLAILLDSIMTYFGATAYDACYNAFIVDVSVLETRGRAESMNEGSTLFATLLVYGLSGILIDSFGYDIFFLIIGLGTGVFGLIGAYFMRDTPDLKPLDQTLMEHLKSTFHVDSLKQNKECFKVLIGIAIWAIGFSMFFPFIVIYLEHHLGFDILSSSLVMFISLMISVLMSIPIGYFVDKVGRKRITIISLIGVSLGLTIFSQMTEFIWVLLTGIFWVFFMTTFHIAGYTWVKDLYPKGKAGEFSGYYLIANVLIGMVIGSPLGGWLGNKYGKAIVINGQDGVVPPPFIYLIAAIIILFAIIPFALAKEKEHDNEDLTEPLTDPLTEPELKIK